MRSSFVTLALAGLVASAVAAPLNDGHKYEEKKVEEAKYDDKKYDDKKYVHDDKSYDDKKVDEKKYHDVKYDPKKEEHKAPEPKKEHKAPEPKKDDYKKEEPKKEEPKKEDYKKEEPKKEEPKKEEPEKEEPKKEDYKKDDKKYDDKKVDDKKYDDKKVDDKKYDDKKEYDYKEHSLSAFPFHFTSTFHAKAVPNTIIASDGSNVPGQEGAYGLYNFGINSYEEVICFNITLKGVTGEYQSPANTATHIHEAGKGQSGPPRIAFPNPTGDDYTRTSFGCLKGPFETGLTNAATGLDQGAGFSLAQIEANPSGFFADVHTATFVAGAVRGQLERK